MDNSSDLETKLAEAREALHFRSEPNIWSQRRGFDVAANIAREVVAEKDAEIARLKADLQIVKGDF
jgi:hypothetical protein